MEIPPHPEQTAIAAILSDMDLELAALEQRRDKTRALKQAMMQELHDLTVDPFEIHNLADGPVQRVRLVRLRRLLTTRENESGDRGREPEPEAVYDSDMAAYLGEIRRNGPESVITIEKTSP